MPLMAVLQVWWAPTLCARTRRKSSASSHEAPGAERRALVLPHAMQFDEMPRERRRVDVVVDEQECEERHQIDDRVVEHAHRELLVRRPHEHRGVVEKSRAEDE